MSADDHRFATLRRSVRATDGSCDSDATGRGMGSGQRFSHNEWKDLGGSALRETLGSWTDMVRLLVLAVLALASLSCGGVRTSLKSPVYGLLIELHASDFGQADSFKLRAYDGKEWEFRFEPEPGASVPFGHLQLHLDRRLPVKVSFHPGGSPLTAFRVDDG